MANGFGANGPGTEVRSAVVGNHASVAAYNTSPRSFTRVAAGTDSSASVTNIREPQIAASVDPGDALNIETFGDSRLPLVTLEHNDQKIAPHFLPPGYPA